MTSTIDLETLFLEVLKTPITTQLQVKCVLLKDWPITIKHDICSLHVNHICPNNLPLWQSMRKPQQTNEHMKEVINYSTNTHLLNTIKSILTQTLEKLCKKRVYGK